MAKWGSPLSNDAPLHAGVKRHTLLLLDICIRFKSTSFSKFLHFMGTEDHHVKSGSQTYSRGLNEDATFGESGPDMIHEAICSLSFLHQVLSHPSFLENLSEGYLTRQQKPSNVCHNNSLINFRGKQEKVCDESASNSPSSRVTRLAWNVGIELRGCAVGNPEKMPISCGVDPAYIPCDLRDDKMLHCMKRKSLERMETVGP
jgi:hypothetical protein